MSGNMPIFYSAMMLTGVNLLLRFIGTGFQIYISNTIGAAGVGLLQLMMSVGTLALIAGTAGIRTGTMYLAAEEIGKQNPQGIPRVLSGCFRYSIFFSTASALILYFSSHWIAKNWIGNSQAAYGLKIYAAFLPSLCLCGVMTGLYTAENRIRTLALVEIAEQFVTMIITVALLKVWARSSAPRACQCILFGNCCGCLLTLGCLILLRKTHTPEVSPGLSVKARLRKTALPLAAADNLKACLNTAENLMVPKRLALCYGTSNPLAAFGSVVGMVFPVIMFPACILFGLSELLIPELARSSAANNRVRIRYLAKRSLTTAMLYGAFFSGLLYLMAEDLSLWLYQDTQPVSNLKKYALLVPMLYCDGITDAMIKGLGQQKICVLFNIVTSVMDMVTLYILLPRYGMQGYFFSFTLCHLVNFVMSIVCLVKITRLDIPCRIPVLTGCIWIFAVFSAGHLHSGILRGICYCLIFGSTLYLSGIVSHDDLLWLYRLFIPVHIRKKQKKPA